MVQLTSTPLPARMEGLYEWSGGRLQLLGEGNRGAACKRNGLADEGRVVVGGDGDNTVPGGVNLLEPGTGESISVAPSSADPVGESSDASRIFFWMRNIHAGILGVW